MMSKAVFVFILLRAWALNDVRVVEPQRDLPKLPVARVLWNSLPNLKTAAAAWIYGGGAHHTGFSMAINSEHMQDFADMAGVECLKIDADTSLYEFKLKCLSDYITVSLIEVY